MMPEFAREGLVIPVKRRLNAMDAFSGCCEGFSIKLSDELARPRNLLQPRRSAAVRRRSDALKFNSDQANGEERRGHRRNVQ